MAVNVIPALIFATVKSCHFEPVLPEFLCIVQGAVGAADKLVQRILPGIKDCHSHTDGYLNSASIEGYNPSGYHLAKPLGERSSLRFIGIGQQKDKLFAAKPGKDIVWTDDREAYFAHLLQDEVARQVTITVINHFEVIDIKEDDRKRTPVAPRSFNFTASQVKKVSTIENLCQIIRDCQVTNFHAGLLKLDIQA